VTDLAQDHDDLQALMAPPRTPNVYAALERLNDEPAPVATVDRTDAAVPEVSPAAAERMERQMEWSALGKDQAATATEPSWAAMGAEPVGPEVLRWRREDDDIVPSGGSAGRSRLRLQLRRRSAA
jgi:hypothetical protein